MDRAHCCLAVVAGLESGARGRHRWCVETATEGDRDNRSINVSHVVTVVLTPFAFGIGFAVQTVTLDAPADVDEVTDADGALMRTVVEILECIEQVGAFESVLMELFGPCSDASLVGTGRSVIEDRGHLEHFGCDAEFGFGGVDVHRVVTSWSSSLRASSCRSALAVGLPLRLPLLALWT